MLKQNKIIYWIIMAIVCGLAVGTKTIALSFLIIPFTVWLILLWKERKWTHVGLGLGFVSLAFLIFFLVSPYTILNFNEFQESMNYESGVVSGQLKVPYTWQFSQTLPYLFFYKNLHWHTSLLVPTLGFLGILIWTFFIIKRKRGIEALPILFFALVYFGYVGGWHTKFIRYMLPIIPILTLGTVWLILQLRQSQNIKLLRKALLVIVLLSSISWSFAFISIYKNPSTRVTASQWIYEQVPKGSILLTEHWDDGLPTSLPTYNSSQYIYLEMKNYDADTAEKISMMAENLAEGDFLILSSRRLSGSIGKNPGQWPITSGYYTKLFQEKLGYDLVQTVTSYPKLLNFEIKDDAAEETLQVYDHPTVHIFQNTGKLSKEKLQDILIN